VPLAALVGRYSATYLRLLVERKRLRAIRDGNLWLSSRAWLREYIAALHPGAGARGGTPAAVVGLTAAADAARRGVGGADADRTDLAGV
jgi:hypothetical protein